MEQIKQEIKKQREKIEKDGWEVLETDTDGFFAVKDGKVKRFQIVMPILSTKIYKKLIGDEVNGT